MNKIVIGICVLVLLINSYSWYNYAKITDRETREKDGWNRYYLLTTLFFLYIIISKIESSQLVTE